MSRGCVLALVAGACASVHGAIVLEKVVDTSDVVPGVSGGSWALGLNGFQAPSIDESGNVAFRGNITGVPTGTTTGTWFGAPGSVSLVTRQGDATLDNANSGGAGATITSYQTQVTPMSVNGKLWIGATITGGSVVSSGTTADNRIFWTGNVGSAARHARRWDVMPGTAGARFSSAPDSTAAPQMVNRSGQSFVSGSLAANTGDTGAIGTNDAGIWFGAAGATQLVLRRQDAAPGLSGGERVNNLSHIAMNDAGTLFLSTNLRSGEFGVTLLNDSVLYRGTVGSMQPVAREATNSGIAGVDFGSQSSTLFPMFQPGRAAMNASGTTIFSTAVALTGSGVTSGVDDAAIFVNSGSGNSIFKRKGSAAPGVAGTTLAAFNMNETSITNSNNVAWTAQVAGTGVTTANDRALWQSNLLGSDILIAREGDAAPGIADAFLGEAGGVLINSLGHMIFTTTLTGSGVTTANDRTLWAYVPGTGLQLLAREGDTLFGTTISTFSYDGSANGSGSFHALNDLGWFTFKINGAGTTGSSVVIRTMIPSPAGASVLALAGLAALRRRRSSM